LIDPGMGYRNLLKCIASVRPEFLIGVPKACFFRLLFPKPFTSLRKTLCCGPSLGLFGPDIRKHAAGTNKSLRTVDSSARDLAAIIFTTGSTGPPKGVRYEHQVFHAQLQLIGDIYGVGAEDMDQPAFPLFGLFAAALGAAAVIPDMDSTRPAQVDPERFIRSLNLHGVSYSFGSPALWNVVSHYCLERGIILDSLRLVLMAGAPVSGELIERMQQILPASAKIHTPYGATESLPVASIEGREIVAETWPLTRQGKGTCVGRALPGIQIRIIPFSDDVIKEWDKDRCLGVGEIGEIVIRGPVVTRAYEGNPKENALSKIKDHDAFWHRMGDLGYFDDRGRLWFCGRRAHRVTTHDATLFSVPCEAIINEHPQVFRSALVGIPYSESSQFQHPVLIVETAKDAIFDQDQLLREVRELAAASDLTRAIEDFLIHPDFPVDIRHNAKIFREKLAVWAHGRLKDRA
nr:AMP-binding protein [Candidatus Desulfatifera sulfidica]